MGYRQYAGIIKTGVCVCAALCLWGCGGADKPDADGRLALTAWAHHGKPEEWHTIQRQIDRFNAAQDTVRVELVEIAEGNYDTQVQSAAASRDLPDILEFDGPMLANYVWKGYLKPLDDVLSPEIRTNLLPSIVEQGTFRDHLYAVGAFDSGLALFGNRAMLEAVGARIPTNIAGAWTISAFDDLVTKLSERRRAQGGDGFALDLKRDYQGEWWTYGFYPVLRSAGVGLIDTNTYRSADGVLNSSEAVGALEYFQRWMKEQYIDPNTDGRAFIDGRVGLSWVGHWEYPRYRKALGDDLKVIPLPDFGHGTRTAMGSWCWGVTRNCRHPKEAAALLEFLLSDREVLAITRANGAVPGTQTAAEQSELYAPGAPLNLLVRQLRQCAVPRPETPAYPVITSAFQEAMLDILNGADIRKTLDQAVDVIDENIEQNDGYPFL